MPAVTGMSRKGLELVGKGSETARSQAGDRTAAQIDRQGFHH